MPCLANVAALLPALLAAAKPPQRDRIAAAGMRFDRYLLEVE
jgi:hypothetical protein